MADQQVVGVQIIGFLQTAYRLSRVFFKQERTSFRDASLRIRGVNLKQPRVVLSCLSETFASEQCIGDIEQRVFVRRNRRF